MDSIYAGCLGCADWCLRHRRLLLLVGAPAFASCLAAIGRFVLQDFPNSGDEYAYLYEAATFAQGRLWNQAPAAPEFFALNYIVIAEDRAYSSFPIGWPLLLTLAAWLRVPVWMVNPILGTLSLILTAYLGTRLHNARVGMLAAAIVAVSGFFLFNAASYFSHTFCSALLLAAACVAVRRDRFSWWVPVVVGCFVGWAVLARYFTAVVCSVPVTLLLFRHGAPVVRTLALVALGGLPWILLLASYNLQMNGSPWQLTTLPTTVGLWFAPKFAMRGADILSTQMLRFVLWTPPSLLFIYIYCLARAEARVRRGLIDWMPVLMAAALYCYIERGGNQYGPRFYYETFPFLAVFTAANLFGERAFSEKSSGQRRAFALMAVSIAAVPVSFAIHVFIEHRIIAERRDPYVQAAGLRDAIVLIDGRVGTTRSMGPLDLTRNGIEHTGRVLYGVDLGDDANCRVLTAYPDRQLYRYAWNAEQRRGALTRLSCARADR